MFALSSLKNFLHAALISLVLTHTIDATPVVDLGIRYAAAPTGSLRFQAPAPPPKISGIQQAFDDPPQCYQGVFGASSTSPFVARDVEETEDCLFLSVYSPNLNPTALLPTIIWIHGGGYAIGSASQYNGADLVQDSNNQVVVVVIQYRLGLFGFLAGQEMKDDGALNAGLRQLTKNLPSDGSTRISINSGAILPKLPFGGQSAGSSYICTMDSVSAQWTARRWDINTNVNLASFEYTFPFGPVIDGSFITRSPTDALMQGQLNRVDKLLAVTNTNEGVIFVNQSVEYDVAEYVRNLFPLLGVNAIMGEGQPFSSAHGQDVVNYFPSFTAFNYTLIYNNTAFINAFTQSFISRWEGDAEIEMVFNETESGVPDIAPVDTSSDLLERCEFWKSVRYLIGQ
ncbi:Carboxylic ester hydrolase [Mycena sanguinolenta]|uniref:Carboxylic ester hydrolase n=1 Tax=Mycena sanguinolenta TaxID=230812 RepID=A0A8H6XS05_9AGAR|nr:Carboxylic ester hydrolase [Mycena sanguinolenta]